MGGAMLVRRRKYVYVCMYVHEYIHLKLQFVSLFFPFNHRMHSFGVVHTSTLMNLGLCVTTFIKPKANV